MPSLSGNSSPFDLRWGQSIAVFGLPIEWDLDIRMQTYEFYCGRCRSHLLTITREMAEEAEHFEMQRTALARAVRAHLRQGACSAARPRERTRVYRVVGPKRVVREGEDLIVDIVVPTATIREEIEDDHLLYFHVECGASIATLLLREGELIPPDWKDVDKVVQKALNVHARTCPHLRGSQETKVAARGCKRVIRMTPNKKED